MIERDAGGFTSADRERGMRVEGSMIGCPAIDWLLSDKGLTLEHPALHELVADSYGSRPAIRDFALAFIASLMHQQLIMVTGRRDVDCLWAMEQALRSPNLAVVIGMVGEADMIASRRLSLAASARWRINTSSSAPANFGETLLGRTRWRLTLERCRNGRTGYWVVEWDHATHRFHLVAPMADQSPAQGRGETPNRLAG